MLRPHARLALVLLVIPIACTGGAGMTASTTDDETTGASMTASTDATTTTGTASATEGSGSASEGTMSASTTASTTASTSASTSASTTASTTDASGTITTSDATTASTTLGTTSDATTTDASTTTTTDASTTDATTADTTTDGGLLFDCFGCGCDAATHYCVTVLGGVVPALLPADLPPCPEVTDPYVSGCHPFPGRCLGDPSCACLGDLPGCFCDMAVDHVDVTCPLP